MRRLTLRSTGGAAPAEQIVAGGKELVGLMEDLGDSRDAARVRAEAIDAIEMRGDKITHDTIALLHETFITLLERDDIHPLIDCMDDILDRMQDVAESINLCDIGRIIRETRPLADICLSCGLRVKSAVALLPSMENGAAIIQTCQEIDRLESDADRVMG